MKSCSSVKKSKLGLKNQQGFGILEVLVAAGFLALLSVGTMTLLENSQKSQRSVQAKDEQRDVIADIRTHLNSRTACLNTFGTTNVTAPGSVTAIKDAANADKYVVNALTRSPLLRYSGFAFSGFTADAGFPNRGNANLVVTLAKTANISGVQELRQSIALRVITNAADVVTDCFSLGSVSEGAWQPDPANSGNIAFGGGNVGIGTLSPATALDVDGAFSMRGQAAAPAVAPVGQGRIYFDSASNKMKMSENGGAYDNMGGLWKNNGPVPNSIYYSAGRVAIGTNTPTASLSVSRNAASLTPNDNSNFHMTGADGFSNALTVDAFGDLFYNSPYFTARKARGTAAAPTAVAPWDILSSFQTWAHDGTSLRVAGEIATTAIENWTPTASGSRMQFVTTEVGTTNQVTTATMTGVGLGIKNINFPLNTLDVNGSAAIGTYAGVNTAPANGLIVSGDVGIGTTTPSGKLDVQGGTAAAETAGSNITINAQRGNGTNRDGGDIILTPGLATGSGQSGSVIISPPFGFGVGSNNSGTFDLQYNYFQALPDNSAPSTASISAGNFTANVSPFVNSPGASTFGIKAMAMTGSINNNGSLTGISAEAGNANGLVVNATAVSGQIYNDLLGTITNAYGGNFSVGSGSGPFGSGGGKGTFTNSYGVYTGAIYGTNKWSFYASDAAAANYFAGRVGIGNLAPAKALHVGSAVLASGVAVADFQNADGTCTITPAAAGSGIACVSDERLKENFQDVTGAFALDRILKLQAVTYNFKTSSVENRRTGYKAQEIQKVAPEFVRQNDDGLLQVYYDAFIPWITESIKTLYSRIVGLDRQLASVKAEKADKAEVDQLKDQNAAKDRKIKELEQRLDKIERLLKSK